jgi:hypothetical protein
MKKRTIVKEGKLKVASWRTRLFTKNFFWYLLNGVVCPCQPMNFWPIWLSCMRKCILLLVKTTPISMVYTSNSAVEKSTRSHQNGVTDISDFEEHVQKSASEAGSSFLWEKKLCYEFLSKSKMSNDEMSKFKVLTWISRIIPYPNLLAYPLTPAVGI